MSTVDQRPGAGRRAPVLSPSVILLLGLAALAVCLLLLFGPFYPEHRSPGLLLQSRLRALLGPNTPYVLWTASGRFFVPLLALLLGLVLVLVPWRTAAGRSRSRGGPAAESSASGVRERRGGPAPRVSRTTRVSRTERNVALSFADDGSIVADGGTGELRRSVSDLRLMARAVGIPWHTDYETEGGARAFLEILRALHTGPSSVLRADEHGAPRPPGSGPAASAAATAGAGDEAGSTAARDSGEEHENPDDGAVDARDGSPGPAWSPSDSGSFYTSTTLYSSERTGHEDTHGDDEDAR